MVEEKESIAADLTQEELLALARVHFTDHYVSRDRIRDLSKGRKRGPKALSGKFSA